MATTIRPELSEKNPYWIERHRYYELKHFCLQYPIWKKALKELDGLSKGPSVYTADATGVRSGEYGDPTARCAEKREKYWKRMELIEMTATATDCELEYYILIGVTQGISYDNMAKRFNVPCCKEVYYNLYRRFFWLLDKRKE